LSVILNCFILGGAGFIGSHLTEALLKEGYNLTVFDRKSAPFFKQLQANNLNILQGDFLTLNGLEEMLENIDIIVHLISTTVPKTSNENPIFDAKSNLLGTIKLLEIARKKGIKKIVFASSGGTVYGVPQEIPISESHPTNPINSYGIIKLTIEKYLYLYHYIYGIDYCILRMSNVYGERQTVSNIQGLIPTIVFNGLQKKETVIYGDGSVVRDYLYVSDAVNAFVKAIAYSGDNKIFNIGSGKGYSINEIISYVEKMLNNTLLIKHEKSRSLDVPINILDNKLSEKVLGWKPIVDISEGIFRTINYIKNNMTPMQKS
jgi:UDP-glucose 4-epimerase